jgi:hypothetical protein
LGDRTASRTAFTGASDLERQQIGVFGTHLNTLSTVFDGLFRVVRNSRYGTKAGIQGTPSPQYVRRQPSKTGAPGALP